MAIFSIRTAMPCTPVLLPQSYSLNRQQVMELARGIVGTLCSRADKCLHLRVRSGEHNTNNEAKGGDDKLHIAHGCDVAGGVVALGKFDALHVGHRALAVQASKMGSPFLLSFTGMAEVLQWEKRLPIIAACDRKRIMSLWAEFCGGIIPRESCLEFSKIRTLSPHEFVEKMAKDLLVKGVVAGVNYRFGYKAAGDASDLVQLCHKFGLEVFIMDPVMDEMDKSGQLFKGLEGESTREKGQISSTRVRRALSIGDMECVANLLGREHRVLLALGSCTVASNTMCVPISNTLNQLPGQGVYKARLYLKLTEKGETSEEWGELGEVKIGEGHVMLRGLQSTNFNVNGQKYIAVDFQHKLSDCIT